MAAIRAVAVQAHHSSDDGVLEFNADEIVYVTEQHQSGWWGGYKESAPYESGWFPGQRVRICEGVAPTPGMAEAASRLGELTRASCSSADASSSTGGTRRVQGRGESDASTRSTRTSSRSRNSAASPVQGRTGTRVSDISVNSSVASASIGASAISAIAAAHASMVPQFAPGALAAATLRSANSHHAPVAVPTEASGTLQSYWSASSLLAAGAVPQFSDGTAVQQQGGASCPDGLVENRTAEIVAILSEIQEISRAHRVKEEELREERRGIAEEKRGLANAEAVLRADRAEITSVRRQLEKTQKKLDAERAEMKAARVALAARAEDKQEAESKKNEVAELQSELENERRNAEAQRRATDAMRCLYERKIEEKDQELHDQLDRAERRDRMKEAKIRELQQELSDAREAADTVEMPSQLGMEAAAEPLQAASNTRRRLSYSAEYSAPLFATQEEQANLPLNFDSNQAEAMPSAPPSATQGNDTRRRLSYSNAYASATVSTQTPDTPHFEPFGEMAQRLFDSQLEAANSTIIGSTPGASGPPVAAVDPSAITDELSLTQDALPMAPPIPPLQLALAADPPPLAQSAEQVRPPIPALQLGSIDDSAFVAFPTILAPSPIPQLALPIETAPGSQNEAPLANMQQPAEQTSCQFPGLITPQEQTVTQVVAKAAVPPLVRNAAKHATTGALRRKESAGSSTQRSSSERPRLSGNSTQSPVKVSPRRCESARGAPGLSVTPPRVQKESPPRGCVREKVSMFEQRCVTPKTQVAAVAQPTSSHRNSGAALPEALRRGPQGVPTPGGAGTSAGAARYWRSDGEEHQCRPSSARAVQGLRA